jgi:hypothetical protein
MGGYDANFNPPLEDKYKCPVCLTALRDPVQTKCGHRLCSICFKQIRGFASFFFFYLYLVNAFLTLNSLSNLAVIGIFVVQSTTHGQIMCLKIMQLSVKYYRLKSIV